MLKDTLDSIPLSTAKTAWGLLQDVKRAILNEPKRARMTCYVRTGVTPMYDADAPACGTVGCFAGWISLLADANPRSRYVQNNADDIAMNLLGRNLNYELRRARPTLYGDNNSTFHVFNAGQGDGCGTTIPQTKAHARAVVRRISRFMKQNQWKLKRRRLADVRDSVYGL